MVPRYALHALGRSPQRTVAGVFGIVLAIGLLSSVLFYIGSSARDMTQRTIANVPVDMRAQALSYSLNMPQTLATLRSQKDIVAVQPLTMSHFSGSSATKAGQTFTTSTGTIFAVNPEYFNVFSPFRIVQGSFGSSGIVISQDMGTNLGARVGDTVALRLPGKGPLYHARVIGIANMKNADILYAPTDPLLVGTPYNPPANVVIMPLSVFDAKLANRLQNAPPPPEPTVGGNPSTIVQSAALSVDRELHLKINRSMLASDPSEAQLQTNRIRLSLEKLFPGDLRVTDNLAATIQTVKNDVLWAQVLFVFLAIPGVLLAGYLSYYAAEALVERQRREFALLRARGGSGKQIVQIAGVMSVLIGLVGSVLGIGVGVITTLVLFGSQLFDPANWRLWGISMLWCVLAGLLISGVSTFLPVRRMLKSEVVGERQTTQRAVTKPLWSRLYLDVAALVVAFVVYRLTQNNGFQPVLNAEGNPTITISYFTFLAPLLFWLGAVLLLVRTAAALLRRYSRNLGWLLKVLFGEVGGYAATSTSRRARAMSKAVVIVALALSFGFSTSIFASTYTRQQTVDAQLTLGADVKVVPRPGHDQQATFANTLNRVSGVARATPFKTTVAYVGAEIQDIFGVDVASLRQSTTLSDAFFKDQSAQATMNRLAATPNGIVISEETAKDYSIVLGDHITLRLFNRQSGTYAPTRFTVVGVAREFATAPKDAFLVVNLAALVNATANPTVNNFLVKATSDPAGTARSIESAVGTDNVRVDSIGSTKSQLASSLTSLNLNALTRVEYIYTALIASVGLIVFLLALLTDRRREFATMRALGATGRQLAAFIVSEAGIIGLSGLLVGALIGAIQAAMLVQILTSIFDPPPGGPIPDYGLLLGLSGLSLVGMIVAGAIGIRHLTTTRVSEALRRF